MSPKPKLNGLASIPVLQLSNWKAIGSGLLLGSVEFFPSLPDSPKKLSRISNSSIESIRTSHRKVNHRFDSLLPRALGFFPSFPQTMLKKISSLTEIIIVIISLLGFNFKNHSMKGDRRLHDEENEADSVENHEQNKESDNVSEVKQAQEKEDNKR